MVFGKIFGALGAKKAAKRLDPSQLFTPSRNIFAQLTGPGQYRLTGEGQAAQARLQALGEESFGELTGFGREAFSERYFDALDRLASRREGQAFADTASRLFNVGGATSATQRLLAGQQRDIEDAQLRRTIAAEQAGFSREQDLFNRYLQSLQAGVGFAGFQQQQQAPQQAYLQAVQGKQIAQAQATQSLFGAIGGLLDTGLQIGSFALGGGFSSPAVSAPALSTQSVLTSPAQAIPLSFRSTGSI